MNNLTLAAFGGLACLFILAEISGSVFKIYSNRFYSYFHFVGGALTFLFWQSLMNNLISCLLLTGLVGVLWEIYEYFDWKLFRKRKIYKPQDNDTINDLIMDMLGGLAVVIILAFLGVHFF
jgi:predicted membrane protein